MTIHAICHVEWAVKDLEREKAFLGELFGWTFRDMGPDYALFRTPDGPGGGIDRVDEPTPAIASPQVYVEVADIDATIGKARELGGSVIREKTAIEGGFGHYARITDPEGNPIGLHQA